MILAIAAIIALLGVAFGSFEAFQSRNGSNTTTTIQGPTVTHTSTSTISGANVTSTTTTTKTSTSAVVVTIPGGPLQPMVTNVTVGVASSDPQGMAFNPTNNEMYVALENSSAVAVINAATGKLIATIPLASGDAPFALAYDSANNMVYVANFNSNTCSPPAISTCSVPVIDSATNTVVANIPTPDTTNGVAVNPATNTVFLASNDDDAMFFIDGATNAVSVLQVHGGIPDNAQGVTVNTANGNALVSNWYHKRTAAEVGFVGNQSAGGCLATNTNSSFCITKSITLNGGKIDGIAVNPNTGLIYAANINANVVNVISESTGNDIANITVPSPSGVTINPSANLVYVTSNSTGMDSLVVISGSTNAVLGSVPVGSGPANVAVDTNTNMIYVSNQYDGTVSVIDGTSLISGASGATVSTITLSNIISNSGTSDPQGMAFNPTNDEIYVALDNASAVVVVNATSGNLVTAIPLVPGDQPVALAYDSANDMVYVANSNSSTVPVIDCATNTLASTITVPDTTNGVAVNPTTNTIFLASNDDDAMFFINGATSAVSILQVHGGIPDNAQDVAVDTSNGQVFVANWYHTRAAAEFGFVGNQSAGGCLATNTNSSFCITESLTLAGGQIDGIAVNPNTGLIYVANYKGDVVNVISEATGADIANITAPSPVGVTVDPYSNLVYVASNSTSINSLLVISGTTNTILASIPVGNGPVSVVVDSSTNTVFVVNADDGTISEIDGTSLLF